MKITRLLLIITVAMFVSNAAVAQSKATKKADDEFATGGYTEAARLYKTAEVAVKDLTEKGRIFYQIAECYRLSTLFNQSEEWYNKAITAQYYNTDPEVYFNFGIALQEQGKFEEAITQYNKYTSKGGEKQKPNTRIKACETAAEKIDEFADRLLKKGVLANDKQSIRQVSVEANAARKAVGEDLQRMKKTALEINPKMDTLDLYDEVNRIRLAV